MKQERRKKSTIFILLLFLVGAVIVSYPLFSRVYYDYLGSRAVEDFQIQTQALPSHEIAQKSELGYAYNNALLSQELLPLGDPFDEEEKQSGMTEYARMLEVNEKIGVLTVPRLHMSFPIYAGTNESVLQKGVGHMEGTSLPIGGIPSHSVLTAHRGLPENKLFSDLDLLKRGDFFYVETLIGKVAYKVIETKVIEPTDIVALTIQKDKDLLTLLTCTPYMINSHRLLVTGERTEVNKVEEEQDTEINPFQHWLSILGNYVYLLILLIIIISIKIIKKVLKR